MTDRCEVILSDLSAVQPADALAEAPTQDRWIVTPYAGEVSGKMLWSPVRNNPPDVTLALPDLGLCRIYVGIYGSGTWPWWFNLIGAYGAKKDYNRLKVRFDDQEWFDTMTPANFPEEQRLGYISEMLWKTADVSGRSIVFAPERKEAFQDTTVSVAYVRLVPVEEAPDWPAETKRLIAYFDGTFYGHFVDSRAEVRSFLEPLRDADFRAVFWNTCREDSCYYPSKVGNPLRPDAMVGMYPYWAGRDMHRMLDAGDDPLRAVCEVGREIGLEVYASYRRMTCRMPPFVFPIHPDAMFETRPDLRCTAADGAMVPHLSLAYPEVRQRMVAILAEQAENYDIDGVHHFFCRGMPFVYYEQPVIDYCRDTFGVDARALSLNDERLWKSRAHFFVGYCRELRAALDGVGAKKGKRLKIAMHVLNNPRVCAYFGMDIETMIREGLVDILLPGRGHFFPEELGEARDTTPETMAEFCALAEGTGTEIIAAWEKKYWQDGMTLAQRAKAFYAAGCAGLHVGESTGISSDGHMLRRFGHIDELDTLDASLPETERIVRVDSLRDLPFDLITGTPTCG